MDIHPYEEQNIEITVDQELVVRVSCDKEFICVTPSELGLIMTTVLSSLMERGEGKEVIDLN